MRELRDCPKCGAHKGFACHNWETMPTCPQLDWEWQQDDYTLASLIPPQDEQ